MNSAQTVPPILTSHWLYGLAVSLLLGALASGTVVATIRRSRSQFFSGLTIGIVERLFFTVGVAYALPAAIIPTMVAWVAAKMATGWNLEKDTEKAARVAALGGGLASMFFALIGGLIASDRIQWN